MKRRLLFIGFAFLRVGGKRKGGKETVRKDYPSRKNTASGIPDDNTIRFVVQIFLSEFSFLQGSRQKSIPFLIIASIR